MNMLKLELTDRCNGNCIFCDRSRVKNGTMPLDMFKRVVDEFPEVKEVMPQFFGEATLHPEFYEALEYLKEKGKRIIFYTNGSHIDCERLAKVEPYTVLFSVEAHNKELFEQLRPGLKWETVLGNITKFQALKTTTTTVARMTITKENKDCIDDIIRFWQDKVDSVFGTPEHPQNREIKGNYKQVSQCSRPSDQMTVKWNGDVVLCCVDVHGDYVMGNVRDGARKVWESERFREARKKVNSEPFDICRTCAFKFKSC